MIPTPQMRSPAPQAPWRIAGKKPQRPCDLSKIANFVHEFRASYFLNLNLLPLPSELSRLNVHAMLTPIHIAQLLRLLMVILMFNNK